MVVIGLAGERIDLLVCQGARVIASRRLPMTAAAEPEAWRRSLASIAPSLRDAVTGLGAAKLPARVYYQSPTACADHAPMTLASLRDARQAAILSSAERLDCPMNDAVFRTIVVGRNEGSPATTHLVVAADEDRTLAAIADMASQAGLAFQGAVLIDAATMTRLVSHALESKSQHCAHLYIGEHRSFFVIAHEGNVLFARAISIGIDALVTSLTRPIRGGASQAPFALDREEARALLNRWGFPQREAIVDAARGISGSQVIPLLQPVLQRFIVELRQSLRFALSEDQRRRISVVAMGPGAALPGFAGILSAELDLDVQPGSGREDSSASPPDSPGDELIDAMRDARLARELGLQPTILQQRHATRRVQRCLWTGAAAAIALMAFDGLRNHERLIELRRQAQLLTTRSDDAKALENVTARVTSASAEMAKLEGLIVRETGTKVAPGAMLHELGLMTPASIRLTEVSLRRADARVTGSIAGYAFQEREETPNRDLQPFIERLRTSPLLEDVVLSNVQGGSLREAVTQRFEIGLVAVSAADHAPAAGASASAGGSR